MPDETSNNSAPSQGPDFDLVTRIINLLAPLSTSAREHILRTVVTWFNVGLGAEPASISASRNILTAQDSSQTSTAEEKFSERPELSAKDFLFEKDPVTDVERMACLAYYLTHYLDKPHFQTVDLSRLNTEAAQRKFSNPAVACNNALRDGFFVQAPKAGLKQLSAMGERFVQLLPNRQEAQKVRQRMLARRRPEREIEAEKEETTEEQGH